MVAAQHDQGTRQEPIAPHGSIRRILHVDMDAFFASVEQMDDPFLRGRAVVVGGAPTGRGVVAAASYEARAFGIRSAMPASQALRRCPDLLFVRPRFARYKEISARVFQIFREITPLVEGLSIDEAFLDVSEHLGTFDSATNVARHIRARIREEIGLTASAGVAPLKFVAKIASGYRKPDGLTVVAPQHLRRFLDPLPVGKIWGVGPHTNEKLAQMGLHTIGDVAKQDRYAMVAALGRTGDHVWRLSQGQDSRPVHTQRDRRGRSAERTFETDILSRSVLEEHLARLVDRVVHGLVSAREKARTVVVKIRYNDFTTVTRSETLSEPTNDAELVYLLAHQLLVERTEVGARPVRLLGLGVRIFEASEVGRQLALPFP